MADTTDIGWKNLADIVGKYRRPSECRWKAHVPSLRWLLVFAFLLGPSEMASSASEALCSKPKSPNVPLISTAQLSEPVPGSIVEVKNGPTPGSVEIRANEAVDLAPELMVERQLDDGALMLLEGLDVDSMKLVTFCGQPVGACVRVDERGLRPVPWTGMSSCSQCTNRCDWNFPLGGRFRFVVTTCDGKQRFAGPFFELPGILPK